MFGRESQRVPWNTTSVRRDVTAGIVIVLIVPVMLAFIGLSIGDLAFAVPALFAAWAAIRAGAAAARGRRTYWPFVAAGSALSSASVLVLVVAPLLSGGAGPASRLLDLAAGAMLTFGFARELPRLSPGAHHLLDALLGGAVLAGLWVVFVPGLGLAGVTPLAAGLSLTALLGALIGLYGSGCAKPAVARAVTAGMALFAVANVLAYADSLSGLPPGVAALAFTAAFALVGLAADYESGPEAGRCAPEQHLGAAWVVSRVAWPLVAALVFPSIAMVQLASGELTLGVAGVEFGVFCVILGLAFGRQAYVLIENRAIVAGEREMREEAERRSQELEALTGLAATMTQTLEEEPIIEQGLKAVQLAGRANGAGLFLAGTRRPVLVAQSGTWERDEPWAMKVLRMVTRKERQLRAVQLGGRSIAYVLLRARDRALGGILLVRGEDQPYDDEEMHLLALLGDELAIAIQNARDYREKLEQAIRDPLTNVYNHRFFHETLGKEMERSSRYGSMVSLVLLDLDDFKQINDSEGHMAGDEVLRKVARIAEGFIRPSDSVARLGGEEFGILLPETDRMEAYMIAERIRSSIAAEDLSHGVKATISAGLASCPQDAGDAATLYGKADTALYWSKRNGKNLCSVTSEETERDRGSGADTTITVLHQLVAAIDARELNTRDHSENVSTYAVAIGRGMGLDEERLSHLHRAAYLHDLGKVAVSREILVKPRALSDSEWAVMERHPAVGSEIAAHAGLAQESDWIRAHHERFGGGGYPKGLAGDAIPLEARIIFAADSFEAMTSDRPYRQGMDVEEAIEELRRCSGEQFDPGVVETLVSLVEEGEIRVVALREKV